MARPVLSPAGVAWLALLSWALLSWALFSWALFSWALFSWALFSWALFSWALFSWALFSWAAGACAELPVDCERADEFFASGCFTNCGAVCQSPPTRS